MGTVTKRVGKNGEVTFQAKVRRKDFPTQSKTFHERRDADKWIRAAEAAMDRGERPQAKKRAANGLNTLADVLRRYRDTVSPPHRGGDIEVIAINPWLREPFSKTMLADLSAPVMAAWRDDRLTRLASSSVARQMNLLYGAINRARAEWGCEIPKCKISRPKSPPHRDRVLTAEEEKALLAAARAPGRSEYLAPCIEFALATAMRSGEIMAMRWTDIDWNRKVVRLPITKNGQPREVPLSTKAIAAQSGLSRKTDRVFEGLTPETLKRQFVRLTRRCDIKNLHFHDLRHTAITRYARAGLNTIQLSVISGHKDIRMLARYTHLKAEEMVGLMG